MAFTDTLAKHYTRIGHLLALKEREDELGSRVIHMSVQLLSNAWLAGCLADRHRFLLVLVATLYSMAQQCLTPSTLHCMPPASVQTAHSGKIPNASVIL